MVFFGLFRLGFIFFFLRGVDRIADRNEGNTSDHFCLLTISGGNKLHNEVILYI